MGRVEQLARCGGLLVAVAVVAACTSDTRPTLVESDARATGPEAFLDAGGDGGDDVGDAGDVADTDGAGDGPTGVGQPCQLLAGGGCDEGLKCAPELDGSATCQVLSQSPRGEGQPCGGAGADECDQGLLCASPDPDGTWDLVCSRICDASTESGCEAGAVCVGPIRWLDEAVGVCKGP